MDRLAVIAERIVASGGDIDRHTLDQLVEMAGESMGFTNWKGMVATTGVLKEARKFEDAVKHTLNRWGISHKNALKYHYSWEDLYRDNGAYLVLMTLRGEGVGIWDGSWDRYFEDRDQIKKLQSYLHDDLHLFADVTGGGSLNQEFLDAAHEQSEE